MTNGGPEPMAVSPPAPEPKRPGRRTKTRARRSARARKAVPPPRPRALALRGLSEDFRRRAASVLKEIELQEKRIERQASSLARALIKQFRLGVHRRMAVLARRVAEIGRAHV